MCLKVCAGTLLAYLMGSLLLVSWLKRRAPIITDAGCDVAITGGAFPDFSFHDLYVEDVEGLYTRVYTGYPPLEEEDLDELQS